MEIKNHDVIFSTGKKRHAFSGVIGICSELEVTSGYDDGFDLPAIDFDGKPYENLTTAEQIELADHMIGLWQKFKDRAVNSDD